MTKLKLSLSKAFIQDEVGTQRVLEQMLKPKNNDNNNFFDRSLNGDVFTPQINIKTK